MVGGPASYQLSIALSIGYQTPIYYISPHPPTTLQSVTMGHAPAIIRVSRVPSNFTTQNVEEDSSGSQPNSVSEALTPEIDQELEPKF